MPRLRARKGGERIVSVTAYDAPTAALLDAGGVDLILVGDSVGPVLLGYDSTLPVTMDEMVHHTAAAHRGRTRALLVADLPFLSYQPGPADAVRNGGRLIKAGADAVKLEGGAEAALQIAALVGQGIPVMGHVGLTPQRVKEFGNLKPRGTDPESARMIEASAKSVEAAGAFALVLESVPADLAVRITAALAIPVIGIGTGAACDGQVVVFHDLVGLAAHPPPFARALADGRGVFADAVGRYAGAVRAGSWT